MGSRVEELVGLFPGSLGSQPAFGFGLRAPPGTLSTASPCFPNLVYGGGAGSAKPLPASGWP